jgi:hypothetical protein
MLEMILALDLIVPEIVPPKLRGMSEILSGRQDARLANSPSNKRQHPIVLTGLLILVQKGRTYAADCFLVLAISTFKS